MQGRIRISVDIRMDGLLRVRSLPNGRVDLLSIDEQARSQANMMVENSPFHCLAQEVASGAEEDSGENSARQSHHDKDGDFE